MAILIDGKKVSEQRLEILRDRINFLKTKSIIPHLTVIQVGNNTASNVYIGKKEQMCNSLGIKFTHLTFDENVSFEELKENIHRLNNDLDVTGILIQFPLPKHLLENQVTLLIDPLKDVDGLHPFNLGIIASQSNQNGPIPCTANGIIKLLEAYNINPSGKHAVILGRSNIVGRPVSYLLSNLNATVSMIHSKTPKHLVDSLVKSADILVLATGIVDVINPSMVKDGAAIIDVGIIRTDNKRIRGDIDYAKFLDKASFITPVPGGVGPMTIAMLMENVVTLAEIKHTN